MRSLLLPWFLFLPLSVMSAQDHSAEPFQPLPFGSVRPAGWIREQMQKDLEGFVGHLDEIVPALIEDPIYGEGRLRKHSTIRELGNLKQGDAEGEEQYQWWNSETQSNWWDGYIRHVLLLNDEKGIAKARDRVRALLATQDEDGYLGIYGPELRYSFTADNAELWSKTTAYRGLLAYYECTGDSMVWNAVVRGVENVMRHYPLNASSPFRTGAAFNGGVSHGLTFTDVLERMYYHTRDERYRTYALFLYDDYSRTQQSESDAQLHNILDPAYRLRSHGVHTVEHLRALTIAAFTAKSGEYRTALDIYRRRIGTATTLSGAPIGDEWIAGRIADATMTGYEYCSLQELLDSDCLLLQKTGDRRSGDAVERLYYNAAMGARDPRHSCIAYLKTDNSFEMTGTRNGEKEPDKVQTRYKYSPAHQDVAVCCNPNAGRITPYFVQHSWLKEGDSTLVAALLLPNIIETVLSGHSVRIENVTRYPYENTFEFRIRQSRSAPFTLKIRKPEWVRRVVTNERVVEKDGFITIRREFSKDDSVSIAFEAGVEIRKDGNGHRYFSYGALIYARPIDAEEIPGRMYCPPFADVMYQQLSADRFTYEGGTPAEYSGGTILTRFRNKRTGKIEKAVLVPMGGTVLRQVTFEDSHRSGH